MVDFYENRTADALVKLRRAVGIDREEPDYLFSLGQAAARSERYKEAADAYERFLRHRAEDRCRSSRADSRSDRLPPLSWTARLALQRRAAIAPSCRSKPTTTGRSSIFESTDRKIPLRFVLDTGSGMSVISEQTAKKLGIKPVARGGLARAVGGGGRFEIVYGYLNSIDVGEIRIQNVPVYIRQFYDAQPTLSVDGYLGIAALARLLTAVDYGTRRMTLMRQRNTPDATTIGDRLTAANITPGITRPGIEIPVRTTSSGFLSGEVTIEGIRRPLNFIIDTGATISVLSERAAELDEAVAFIQADRMRVFGAAGVAENVKTALLPKVLVGSYAREKINAAVLDLEPINETAGFRRAASWAEIFCGTSGSSLIFNARWSGLNRWMEASRARGTFASRDDERSMKPSAYLETSVIGAYLDNGEPFRRDLTIRWWEHELSRISRGDFAVSRARA